MNRDIIYKEAGLTLAALMAGAMVLGAAHGDVGDANPAYTATRAYQIIQGTLDFCRGVGGYGLLGDIAVAGVDMGLRGLERLANKIKS